MNTFDLFDIACTGVERRRESAMDFFSTMVMDHTFKALDKGVAKIPRQPQQPRNRESFAPVEGSPAADLGTAEVGVLKPTQCSKCGPSCVCDIAWNE